MVDVLPKTRTFHITTFGCQMNVADSSTLVSTLTTRGYRRVQHESEADLLVFNTCSIRDKAEQRVFGRLGEIHKYKKRRPHLKVAVVGCMAQRLGGELIEKAPLVDWVLGTDRIFELPDVIEGIEGTQPVMTAFGHENMDMIAPVKETDFAAFVPITRGCDNYCTYCIVPYVRGKEKSHSVDHILNAVRDLTNEGIVEITVLGQNVNSYRSGKVSFPELLEKIATETEATRIRYMTSHPKDLSRELVDVMARNPKLLRHIHLPLQSGSDSVLARMGRIYTVEHYLKVVEYIRSKLDYVSLTTDLIVGFPGESEADYERTLEVVRQIRYDSAFMFRYSVRPGTTAADYEDDVPEEDKIRRLNKLIAIQQQIGFERNQREVGQVRYSLVEGKSRRSDGVLRARTEGNKTVLFDSREGIRTGMVVPIRITEADAFTLHGDLIEAS